jgi:catechol 2,3-dioxygenase
MRGCLLSQLAHVEVQTPKPEDSLRFFRDVLGMTEIHRDGQSVFLRSWGEWLRYSMILTEGPQPAVVHLGWRTAGAEELELAASRLEASGAGEGWVDESFGHGPAFRYRGPGGQLHELFWEADWYEAPPELRSVFPIRPQRYEPRGAAVRQLDHCTFPTPDIMADAAWYCEQLGYRFMEYTVVEGTDHAFFAELSTNEQAHDMGLLSDTSGIPGRMHHIAFWLDQAVDVLRAADIILEAGHRLEYGPGKHGHGENNYLYLREPGGMRVELFSGGYRNYLPDWKPVRWVPPQGSLDMYFTSPAPDSMLEVFPPEAAEDRILTIEGDYLNPFNVAGVS